MRKWLEDIIMWEGGEVGVGFLGSPTWWVRKSYLPSVVEKGQICNSPFKGLLRCNIIETETSFDD